MKWLSFLFADHHDNVDEEKINFRRGGANYEAYEKMKRNQFKKNRDKTELIQKSTGFKDVTKVTKDIGFNK